MPSSPRLAAKRRRPRYAGLLEDNALEKLQKISSLIDLRGYLKTDEARKVSEAFTLLSAHSEQSDSFQEFLIKVRDLSGPKQGNALVVLCVVAFGKYAIRSTREIIRLSLPRTIANMKEKFSTTVLEKIGEKHSKGLSQSDAPKPPQAEQNWPSASGSFAPRVPGNLYHPVLTPSPGSVPLDFQVKDLMNFLHEYQGPEKHLQMDCPVLGDTLPSIYLSRETDAKIEFSQTLAAAFVQYVMKHRQH